MADRLEVARQAMERLDELTTAALAKLANEWVMPQVEAQWRHQQDALMEIARTNALVSIAESLAVLAGRQPVASSDSPVCAEAPVSGGEG